MSLILTLPDVTFTDATLPKLYRDKSIGAGTLLAYDATNLYSWPSQAAPVAGSSLVDLSYNNNPAICATNNFGFSNGFTKTTATAYFTLPSVAKPAASAAGFVFILWFKYGTQPTTGYNGVAGWMDSNALNTYAIVINNDVSNGVLVYNGGNGGIASHGGNTAGTIYQIAIAAKLEGTTYTWRAYRNGLQIGQRITALTAIPQPTTNSLVGWTTAGAYGTGFVGTIYRSLYDNTSSLATLADVNAFVAADYANNNGQFV